jgi:hypothetical protein
MFLLWGLWYKNSTTGTSEAILTELGCSESFTSNVLHVNQENHRFCATCKKSIIQKRIPRLWLSNGFDFPVIPAEIKVRHYFGYPHNAASYFVELIHVNFQLYCFASSLWCIINSPSLI